MAKKRDHLLGPGMRKLQPKLRMIANGSAEVNAIRSELCSSICVSDATKVTHHCVLDAAAPAAARAKQPAIKRLDSLARTIEANVFVELIGSDGDAESLGKMNQSAIVSDPVPGESARRRRLVAATVRLDQLGTLAARDDVAYIELGEHLRTPTATVFSDQVPAPAPGLRSFGTAAQHGFGEGVLIGIIDVQGFAFDHPDFLRDGGELSRFVNIWDQGGDSHAPPGGFSYGSEITQAQMNAAIAASRAGGLSATALEPQSQMVPSSHGTHVASIAAGNRGVCRHAFIAGVLVSLPHEDMDRRRSFYDSTRLAHAVEYLYAVAERLRVEHGLTRVPVSINISLGTNGHAHDASSAVSRWIDATLATPGRSVCVAAGNAGQEAPKHEGDIGYIMGRIHTSGRIAARGLEQDIHWTVVGNGIADLSENELEIWYSPSDRFAVSVRPPGGDWIGPIEPRQFVENRQLADGSFCSVYNELYYPANGANYIGIYLSPLFSQARVVGVQAGEWAVRLHGRDVRDGRYHGWIERDDPRRLGRIGDREAWRFPSFFSSTSNVDNSSVSSLACGHRLISVANLDERNEKINISSSQGPTRDGRFKPDAAAPGTSIVAANGFDDERRWTAMTGTSMASPFIAGVAGLMLAAQNNLTAAQIGGIIQRTAQPLPSHDYAWRDDAGYGVIDPDACILEALSIHDREDLT